MTGDNIFRDKAEYIAKKLLPAFKTPTGIPYSLVNLKSGVSIWFITRIIKSSSDLFKFNFVS